MVKSFGTDSTATHARESLPKRNGIEVTKNSTKSTQRAQPEGLAKVSDLGDEAFERMNYSEAIKLYKQSIRLLAQNSGDGDHLDLKQCKRYCVLTSMLLKLSRAYLHDEKKEESKKSLVSAEICVRKVTNNELNKENDIEGDIAMVKYSSLTLLSKVMEELGYAHERDEDLTTAEQKFQEALSHKRECIKILREKDAVANVFKNRIQMNLEIALLLKKVGVVMHQRGDFNASRDSFCEALKIRGELKQENGSKEILSLLNNLAEVHKCNGEYAAGLECLECVTRIYENKDEIEPVLMLTLKKSEFYVDNKEYGKAMDVATAALIMVNSQSLEYQERLLTRALITEQIAKIFEAQTKFYDAVLWHRRAHSIRSKLLPDTDELVLECIMHIANIFRKQGNFKGAKVLYKDVRNKLVEKHGVEHIAIADVLDDLGSVYSDQRNTASALNYHMKALEIRRRCKKIGDRETVGDASTMGKIATLCMQRDRILAMKYFSESLNILRQNHLCPKHPTVIKTIRAMTTFEQEEDTVKLLPE